LITAFDYNSLEPRFFSKYFAKMNPNVYDVKIGESTGASSAAPTYFDPKKTENAYGLTELQVDGGIICNNPSLYAYQVAKLLNKKKNIRILSIGTGEKPFIPFTSAKQMGKMSWMKRVDEFMMNMDVHATEYYLEKIAFADKKDDYVRLQKVTTCPMDKVAPSDITNL
jgi:patatin-like phospholipase/acyl hydrolase